MHRVLLVDDEPSLRRLIRRVIERVPEFEVVGEAGDGASALAMALEDPPDIMLTDVGMPGMDGVELTKRLLEAHPEVRVVVLTGAQPGEALSEMIRAGAIGYLVKTASIDEMIQALHAVRRGLAVLAPEATALVLKDLVKHYRSEQQRAESLAALDAMKRDFMNVISHELKTPVTIIKGGLQTLRRGAGLLDPDQQRAFLDSVEDQCVRLQRMIDQVLIVSQIDRSPGSRKAILSLAEHVDSLVADLPESERNRIQMNGESPQRVEVDAAVGQLTAWILENALAFSEGPVQISYAARTGGQVTLSIADEGIGMDEDLVHRVLTEPFTQRDTSLTRPRDGLGLSLYAAREVLENMGGGLTIDSAPNRGTTVHLRFPAVANVRPARGEAGTSGGPA